MYCQIPIAALAAVAGLTLECTRIYVVQPGDTCDSISCAQQVPIYQLMNVNKDIINPQCTNLFPGETLCLGLEGHDCREVYCVEPGDICKDIAEKFHIPLSTLYANNPNINENCTNLNPGEGLCVSPKIWTLL